MDVTGAVLALVLSLLWGANPVAIKLGLIDAPPLRLAVFRFIVGGLVVLLWAWPTGRLAGFRVERHEWQPLVMVGLLLGAQVSMLNIGTSLTSASHSAVLLNLYAVHTVVFAHFMIPGDRLTARKLAGTLIGYSGVVMLLASRAGSGDATLAGDSLMLLSGVTLGFRTVYLARTVQRLDQVKMLLAQAAFGVLVFLAGSLLFESRATAWTWRLAGAVAYQGVAIAGFNFIVNLWLLKHYRPSALATFFLTQPIFGVIAAALVTGDPLTVELLFASVAVAIGIGLTSR
ncbi:MAG: DMT family transporter [Candidatus Rokubacteria bacterium]|nr:DMT family transporter [Candidatus Rokubacteria bacterium]